MQFNNLFWWWEKSINYVLLVVDKEIAFLYVTLQRKTQSNVIWGKGKNDWRNMKKMSPRHICIYMGNLFIFSAFTFPFNFGELFFPLLWTQLVKLWVFIHINVYVHVNYQSIYEREIDSCDLLFIRSRLNLCFNILQLIFNNLFISTREHSRNL